MPAARTKSAKIRVVKKPVMAVAAVRKRALVVQPDDDPASLLIKATALRTASAWSELLSLLDQHVPALHLPLKALYCRAFYHLAETTPKQLASAEGFATELLTSDPVQIDALLCKGRIASSKGEARSAADTALEAFKASGYKDEDALALLQESQAKLRKPVQEEQDHYAALCVAPGAPIEVVRAAHAALQHPPGSSEAAAADLALEVLSDTDRRAAYDTARSHRLSGGFGRDFSGGSELLQRLGEALGLKFPPGFVFPPNGRFQGGFGGGIEFTWGDGA
ncbi:hypothetical protein EHS25_007080 [Saitozyma podzolica]|uniref:J domain-containing protein n=1 Tax=Saitozyma podzolica TaxID=1890683 RepID=A0A427XPI4_9TREE|nr:hypothetical protein EHS25_007080 [Saitozyma podzolica]